MASDAGQGSTDDTVLTPESQAALSNVRAVMQGLGIPGLAVEFRDGAIHVAGPVADQAELDAVVGAAEAVAGNVPVDTSALTLVGDAGAAAADEPPPPAAPTTGREQALQSELDRLLASTPLIFANGQADLSPLHERIINNAALIIQGYPGARVTITGYTDEVGDDVANERLSLARAENVRSYLIGQGVGAESLGVDAKGEADATGSSALAGLERRVEFEVDGVATEAPAAAADQTTLRVAIVAPSARNDLAFTQSMVDAVNVIAGERPVEVAVTDNTFVPDEAAAAVRGYAEQGYQLVIAHGSQFGAALIDIAPEFPETAFAWGTASDTFGLPNVYAYDAAAHEGGYVLGAISSMLSSSKVVGVVGPIEIGDAAQYVNGFRAGALAQDPATDVRVTYTGSFSDIGLASEAANAHLDAGADVLTGSAQMVVGAIAAADQRGARWLGTQADQASLAPNAVVASQVYRWEVALRPVIADLDAGTLAGSSHTASLQNGGLVIQFNPDVALPPEVRQRADELIAGIANGSIQPPR